MGSQTSYQQGCCDETKIRGSVIDPNTDYMVAIRYDGTNFIASVGGVDVITLAPGGPVTGGSVGFKVKATTGTFQRIEVN